ncbi:MAG: AtpZ/AtpI family protein [Lachnospiraceae bacterium]|nr:AtpZ/AtpI family protein [Lachnospiraceae bacterium]
MKKDDYDRDVYRSLAMITQFGINMIVPILLSSAIGLFLDKKLGTGYLVILMFFVGALAGFRNIYRLSKKIFSDPGKTRREKERQKRRDQNAGEETDRMV